MAERDRLHLLIQAWLDDALQGEERAELEHRLNHDPQARRVFLCQLRLEGELRLLCRPAGLGVLPVVRERSRLLRFPARTAAACLAAVAVLAVSLAHIRRGPTPNASPGPVADAAEVRRQLTVQVQRDGDSQPVVTALRPGREAARIDAAHIHTYDHLCAAEDYQIGVVQTQFLPMTSILRR